MTISGFIAYAIQTWKNKPDTSTPLSAARLAHIEAGIKANSDAITKLAAAVINQQANDVNKIPSSALMYSVNEKVDSAISDLATKVTNESSDSHAIALGFGSLGRTNIKVDNTLRTLPVNSGTNYDIAFMEMTVNPNTNKRALKLTWQADGKTYNSYIETDKSDI